MTILSAKKSEIIAPIKDWLIFEQDGIVAFNKPGNLISQGAPKGEVGLVTMANNTFSGEEKAYDKMRPVHRLDKFTSGVIVMAGTKSRARFLSAKFSSRRAQKEYIAILDGKVANDTGTIKEPVGNKAAETHYQVLERKDNLTLVKLSPKTGRRHQLRIHAARALGAPIIGDRDYHPVFNSRKKGGQSDRFAASAFSNDIKARLDGQMLHARSLTINAPEMSDEQITITASLPLNRQGICDALGLSLDR